VHLGPFGCLTRLGAKWANLEQKFVPRNRVEIFCNERTRSTLLDPKLMFWRILYYFGVFGTVWSPYETRCKMGQKVCFHEVASKFFATNAPDPPHCILNSCFGMFRIICVHFEQFGLFTKLGAKRAELVQKFMPRNRFRIFRNECTTSTPLDPKLMFWCVSYYLGCIWERLVALRNSVQNGAN